MHVTSRTGRLWHAGDVREGCGFLDVRYLEAILYEKVPLGIESCPLSGIGKRPLLGGCLSIRTMVISIRNTECVRYREVVRFSEGPLSEVRLYCIICM